MNIAFLGLGNMGAPMALNLVRAGHQLTVYNRTAGRADALASAAARIAATPTEAVADAEAVITMVADDHALMQLAFGETGFLQSLPPGSIHISMSTIGVAFARTLTEMHASAKRAFVSAPVLGRPEAAAAAKLLILAAGPEAILDRCRSIFSVLGQKTIVISTDPPAANVIKLCGNFLIASIIETLGEAFALARKSGVPAAKLLEVLTGSPATAPLVSTYGTIIAEGKFSPPGFRLPLGLKDVRLVLGAGDAAAVPLPVASLLHDAFLTAVGRGYSDLDWSAIAKVAAENAGLP
ncbi:MAG TPA: NAD(P)-dependent oxidoreductase [Candidatus Acidoferrales bacterium]|nr:NAD(P)-dependent oxidoreductase [Candidatus Acidoferrales bacterium]